MKRTLLKSMLAATSATLFMDPVTALMGAVAASMARC